MPPSTASLVAAIAGGVYLVRGKRKWDIVSLSAVEIGMVFDNVANSASMSGTSENAQAMADIMAKQQVLQERDKRFITFCDRLLGAYVDVVNRQAKVPPRQRLQIVLMNDGIKNGTWQTKFSRLL